MCKKEETGYRILLLGELNNFEAFLSTSFFPLPALINTDFPGLILSEAFLSHLQIMPFSYNEHCFIILISVVSCGWSQVQYTVLSGVQSNSKLVLGCLLPCHSISIRINNCENKVVGCQKEDVFLKTEIKMLLISCAKIFWKGNTLKKKSMCFY